MNVWDIVYLKIIKIFRRLDNLAGDAGAKMFFETILKGYSVKGKN